MVAQLEKDLIRGAGTISPGPEQLGPSPERRPETARGPPLLANYLSEHEGAPAGAEAPHPALVEATGHRPSLDQGRQARLLQPKRSADLARQLGAQAGPLAKFGEVYRNHRLAKTAAPPGAALELIEAGDSPSSGGRTP
jgi:hypothetical protein